MLVRQLIYNHAGELEEDNQMSGEDNSHGKCIIYVNGEIFIRTFIDDQLNGTVWTIGRDGKLISVADWLTMGEY